MHPKFSKSEVYYHSQGIGCVSISPVITVEEEAHSAFPASILPAAIEEIDSADYFAGVLQDHGKKVL